MKLKTNSDDAVSPVVGVMLMLVVTIVIAAVITAFATGTVSDAPSSPSVMLEISNPSGSGFDIVHKGGDALTLSNIEISVESVGGYDNGMVRFYSIPLNNDYVIQRGTSLSVPGKGSEPDTVISAGDVIRLSNLYYGKPTPFPAGVELIWTVSDIPTNTLLAEGKYVVVDSESI